MKTLSLINSINHSTSRLPLGRGLLLIALVLMCLALSPNARAVTPAPDGGYPGNNTAEGTDALFSLTGGSDNTAVGFDALYANTNGIRNTALGSIALPANTIGEGNSGIGFQTLYSNTEGNNNTAVGGAALTFNTTGSDNTAVGTATLYNNTTASNNTAVGSVALLSNTGNGNIAVGFTAGYNLTTGSNNIDIGHQGVFGESNTIRIGTKGTQTKTAIAGIYGATTSGGIPVYVNSSGKLGTTTSSARFKEKIRDMGDGSDVLLSLRPVTFRYKPEIDPQRIPQFGLVAEEVEKVNPDLVVRDEQGKIYTVRYDAVNAMLLNEFLKEHRQVQELKSTVAKQEVTIAQQQKDFQATAAQQQKEIEILTTGLQSVSDQLELNKPAPRTVENNQ